MRHKFIKILKQGYAWINNLFFIFSRSFLKSVPHVRINVYLPKSCHVLHIRIYVITCDKKKRGSPYPTSHYRQKVHVIPNVEHISILKMNSNFRNS